LDGGFGLRNVLALDRIDPEREEASKSLAGGADADVGLHEGSIARKVKNGIAGKMVRLELIKIQDLAEEVGGGKAEATLKVSKKDHELTGIEYRFDFIAREPARYSLRYLPRPVEPVDLEFGNTGTHPGSASDWGRLLAGRLAGAARGWATGSLAKATGF
jgi:hypothetical protein